MKGFLFFKWLKNISLAKKLYFVVGIMALLIAVELFTLSFMVNTLSATRALVGAEGSWSRRKKMPYTASANMAIPMMKKIISGI